MKTYIVLALNKQVIMQVNSFSALVNKTTKYISVTHTIIINFIIMVCSTYAITPPGRHIYTMLQLELKLDHFW